jgi:hypothetical protein
LIGGDIPIQYVISESEVIDLFDFLLEALVWRQLIKDGEDTKVCDRRADTNQARNDVDSSLDL